MTETVGDQGPSSFLDSLGERGRRRAEPRTSVSLAGAGCALGVLGVLILAGDTGLDDDTGDFSKVPGILLSGFVVALGYFVLSATRRGSLATAGAVAAALGVPALMFFLTFDQDGGFPPYNTEAILIVSTAVWLGTYLVGPGKGRPFFLGSALIGFWFTVLELTENLFEFPFAEWFFGTSGARWEATGFEIDPTTGELIDPSTGEIVDGGGDLGIGFEEPSFDPPDAATIGMLSLSLGVAFLLVARWLDKEERHGAATPFTFAAIPCLAVGVIGLAPDINAEGSGLLLVVIGLALAYHGATVWRRATSWIGGATTALGLAIFLGDMAGDSATTGGMLYIAGGIAMVFLGHLIASATDEPDELITSVGVPLAPAPRVVVAEPAAPATPAPDDETHWSPPPPIPPPPGAPHDPPT